MNYSTYESFRKYQVNDVSSVEEFLKKYTKHDRHEGRGKEYVESRINSYTEEFEKDGFTFMSHHESITGQVVSFYK